MDFRDTDGLSHSNTKEKHVRPVAVALTDSKDRDDLPRVTAAGRGKIAERIVDVAFEHGIKVREDGPLATMLATVEIDSPIPSEAFIAVAEILSYVYRANGTAQNPFDAVFE